MLWLCHPNTFLLIFQVELSCEHSSIFEFTYEFIYVKIFVNNIFVNSEICTLRTTDYGSCIDLVFTNLTGFVECPWSDYKAVLITINTNLI